ncbi:MAG: substrate-binding domain-containing protein [Lachnospiraceae bacterium]|nr:substrate-binding domain-containing protein [Lachnospiraceae bacterium]
MADSKTKKKKIAIFAIGWCCEILGQFLRGMKAELSDKETDMFLFLCYPLMVDTEAAQHGQLNIFNLPDLKNFDGVVIFASSINYIATMQELFERCRKLDVPVIVQGTKYGGYNTLSSDNYTATRILCEHLLDKHGVKDIIFFGGSENSYDSVIRLKAIQDVLEERGVTDYIREIFYTEWENARVNKYLIEHCADENWKVPDAFICANDGLAMQTCTSLSDHGYTVPDDVKVTGFDHIDESQVFYPAICSVDQLFENTGRICAELWYDLSRGIKRDKDIETPCEFIPGESCGCSDIYNNDDIRREAGRAAFFARAQNNYFSRKLNAIDNTILGSESYEEFRRQLNAMYTADHDYEGDTFHFLLDSRFGLSLHNSDIHMMTTGYSGHMDVIYSTEDGVPYGSDSFSSKELIPGYTGTGPCHLYTFLPIHSGDDAYGYVVFQDQIEKIYNHILQTYQDRLSMAMDKFRRALCLNLLNEQLWDLMKKDPLTNVSNRIAYEAKERELQAEIEIDGNEGFAIAMFDINDLKTVNDTLGHDAGDMYIIRCCRLICRIFSHSPVYRMGGDEFLAVLTGDDFRKRAVLAAKLKRYMSNVVHQDPTDQTFISIACGLADYDPSTDSFVEDVVKRADTEMYRNKREMKAARGKVTPQ